MGALSARRRSDLPSARVYVSAEAEFYGAVDPLDLVPLLTSPYETDRLLARAYGGKFTSSWQSAVAGLEKHGLVALLARRFAQQKLGHLGRAASPRGDSRTWSAITLAIEGMGWICLAAYFLFLVSHKLRWTGHPS